MATSNSTLTDLLNQKVGKLTVISLLPKTDKARYFLCRCECGNEKRLRVDHIRERKVKSCGCWSGQWVRESRTRHGHRPRTGASGTYNSWQRMLARCFSASDPGFENYGAAGITVCERWRHSFDNFLSDMGDRPKGATLHRYPNGAGNYEPSNCRWATSIEQNRNKRTNLSITFAGHTRKVWEWAELCGVSQNAMYLRIKRGWPLEKALQDWIREQQAVTPDAPKKWWQR